MQPPRMNQQQFDEAVQSTRLSDISADAARLVLVDGLSHVRAARQVGIRHRQQVQRAVRCVRKAATAGGVCRVCGSTLGATT